MDHPGHSAVHGTNVCLSTPEPWRRGGRIAASPPEEIALMTLRLGTLLKLGPGVSSAHTETYVWADFRDELGPLFLDSCLSR